MEELREGEEGRLLQFTYYLERGGQADGGI